MTAQRVLSTFFAAVPAAVRLFVVSVVSVHAQGVSIDFPTSFAGFSLFFEGLAVSEVERYNIYVF